MFCEALQTTTVSYIVGSNVTIKVGCYRRHIYFSENIFVLRRNLEERCFMSVCG